MPINDAVAGEEPIEKKKILPINERAKIIQDLANAALRGELTLDEWEAVIDSLEPIKTKIRG